MKLYELTYLMPIDLAEDGVKSLQEKINSFILENQGTLERVEDVVKKRLGEPIKNQTAAQMITLNFYLEPEKLEDVEKKIKSEIQIIHHIILSKILRKAEAPRRTRRPISTSPSTTPEDSTKTTEKPKKVEIKEIEKKLEEILGE